MARRLPPLNALRAFEMAARHRSFKAAAEELGVTPAAVGHQIRGLEAGLGLPLFRRLNRAVELTPAGARLLPGLSEGFARLAEAVASLGPAAADRVLTVSVVPTLAARWLVPRLDAFRESRPEIVVRFDTAMHLVDLARDGVDLAIRFCAGPGRGLAGDVLFEEVVAPVCSPGLVDAGPPLIRLEDLRHHRLLHLEGETADTAWPTWPGLLRSAGVARPDAAEGPTFSQSNTLIAAALAGQGLALVPLMCALDELTEGRLVRPFGEAYATTTDFAYHLVYPNARAGNTKIAAFRDWLLAEAQRHAERFQTLPG
jgi:LysR family glycine cleavage system transcriptional activator